MRISTLVTALSFGAVAAVLTGAALADTAPEPPKGPSVVPGPKARYLAVRYGADLNGGPGLPPGTEVRPFPESPGGPDQTLGGKGGVDRGSSLASLGGGGGTFGGASVASSTPEMRLEQTLRRIAKDLR